MRLTDLAPKWATPLHPSTYAGVPGVWDEYFATIRFGITFRCPCKPGCTARIGIYFDPLINPDQVVLNNPWPWPDFKTWRRVAGETFETLTLAPSVDASQASHWHGFIENGEIR